MANARIELTPIDLRIAVADWVEKDCGVRPDTESINFNVRTERDMRGEEMGHTVSATAAVVLNGRK